jgi:hypothetical protein
MTFVKGAHLGGDRGAGRVWGFGLVHALDGHVPLFAAGASCRQPCGVFTCSITASRLNEAGF